MQSLVAGWPGLDKGTLFLVPQVWKSHTHHTLSLQEISSLPKNRQDWVFQSIQLTTALTACPGHAVLGRVIPITLRTSNLQSITTKCRQRLSLGRSLGKPCPRRHALGMLSLAGSVPAPCERRTYTRKHNPNIFMQRGWELSQQWSSGEFRQIRSNKGMQPKRAKGQYWATPVPWSVRCIFVWFRQPIRTPGSEITEVPGLNSCWPLRNNDFFQTLRRIGDRKIDGASISWFLPIQMCVRSLLL